MELDTIHTGSYSPHGSIAESHDDALDAGVVELDGYLPVLVVGDGARGDHMPATRLGHDLAVALTGGG